MGSFIDKTQANREGDESDEVRFQDFITHELPYGRIQGFKSADLEARDVTDLVRRLGYTREMCLILSGESWELLLESVFPSSSLGKNCNTFVAQGLSAIRIITNQYFLENTEYVLKVTPSLSREKVCYFTNMLFDNLMRFVYRVPASGRARIGKRFLAYLAERDEPSRYLSHGLHPYKGKFHPKMTRALINVIYPPNEGILLDNFAGSGTLLVEASLMGLDSAGLDVNPMSVLMANGKCALMSLPLAKLERAIASFLERLRAELEILRQEDNGQTTIESKSYPVTAELLSEVKSVSDDVYDSFSIDNTLEELLTARSIVEREFKGSLQQVLLLSLAIVISDLKGRKRKRFLERITVVLEDIYRRALIIDHLRDIIPLKIGKGHSFEADSSSFRNLRRITNIDGNVNSPPYSTALDYVKNDICQLAILGLIRNQNELRALENRMGGNPRARYDSESMKKRVERNASGLPEYGMRVIKLLEYYGRKRHAYRLYEFFDLLKHALGEQLRVLRKGAKIATVIGNNHFKLTDHVEVLGNGTIKTDEDEFPVCIRHAHDNVPPIHSKPLEPDCVDALCREEAPVRLTVAKSAKKAAQNGIYLEFENERMVLLLGVMLGLRPHTVIKRLLEKTQRGNIRYETIVIMEKA